MKFPIVTTLVLVALGFTSLLQGQKITYSYDTAGNRIGRTIVMAISQQAKMRQMPTDTLPYTDMLDEASISIYPNPTIGVVKIDISNLPEDGKANVRLYDMNGRMLMQKSAISYSTEIDLSAQSTGAYILKISLSDKTTTWKIIKQ